MDSIAGAKILAERFAGSPQPHEPAPTPDTAAEGDLPLWQWVGPAPQRPAHDG